MIKKIHYEDTFLIEKTQISLPTMIFFRSKNGFHVKKIHGGGFSDFVDFFV
jgi:hypothetical protein